MRPSFLLCYLLVGLLGACATGSLSSFGDDDDTQGTGGATSSTFTTVSTTGTDTTISSTTSTDTTSATTSSETTTPTTTTTSSDTTTTTTTTTTSGSGGACYAGFDYCNPMGSSCGAGWSCDVACDEWLGVCWFDCYEPPNDAEIGEDCDPVYGPYCEPGALCEFETYVCVKYCCTNGDCPGESCVYYGYFYDEWGDEVEVNICQ